MNVIVLMLVDAAREKYETQSSKRERPKQQRRR